MAVAIPTDHAAFTAYRASLRGVGASSVPNVLGIGFRSPFEEWELMTGRREPDTNKRMARGHRLEPVARAWAAELLDQPIRQVRRTVTSPDWPYLFCHPDGRAGKANVQIKTAHRDLDPIPQRVLAQVQVEMLLMRVPMTHLMVMTFDDLYQHEVAFDRPEAEAVAHYVSDWYVRHVMADVPPRDPESPEYVHWLGKQAETEGRRATADELATIDAIRRARATAAEAEREEAEWKVQLMESMKGTTELLGEGFHLTWRRTKDRTKVGYRELASVYRAALEEAGTDPAQLDTIAGLYTTTEEGTRPFRLSFEED